MLTKIGFERFLRNFLRGILRICQPGDLKLDPEVVTPGPSGDVGGLGDLGGSEVCQIFKSLLNGILKGLQTGTTRIRKEA